MRPLTINYKQERREGKRCREGGKEGGLEINGVQFLYQACNSVMALGSLSTADQYRVSSGLVLRERELEEGRKAKREHCGVNSSSFIPEGTEDGPPEWSGAGPAYVFALLLCAYGTVALHTARNPIFGHPDDRRMTDALK
ncbi:hypothetical protein KOW79_021171 [Hemibagrus wyckioides]|uniref:Uncharacterized protein n=1 Tax=Hemibagrus wyckioides TaxID=337641 RepID=A0A9D3N2D2_9TELE|nr:hypothetical protein KOW79_021171 [Hemibagrus wyckioides]